MAQYGAKNNDEASAMVVTVGEASGRERNI
jgi:hypothetical protein